MPFTSRSRRVLLLGVIGAALAWSACSPEGRDDGNTPAVEAGDPAGRELRDEVAALFARLDAEYGVPGVGKEIARTIEGARIRRIADYEYPILNFGEPAFDLEKLREGELPYHIRGDFDCDGKEDRAVLLAAPKEMVVLVLGNGSVLPLPDYDGNVLGKGVKGSHPTAAGKGYGSPGPDDPRHFESQCDFIAVHWWMKSSYAVVYDPESGKFQRFWTSD
jgi:hypothetical protein